jgi:hypothetical protein
LRPMYWKQHTQGQWLANPRQQAHRLTIALADRSDTLNYRRSTGKEPKNHGGQLRG